MWLMPGRRVRAARPGDGQKRRAVEPTAATVRWMRGPAGANPMASQRRERRVVLRAGRLDERAALVAGRADDLLDESVRHPVGVVVGIDDQEVDGPDEATRADRRSEREDGAAHDVPLGLGDEDARLRQVDELAEQISRIERARIAARHAVPRRSERRDDRYP